MGAWAQTIVATATNNPTFNPNLAGNFIVGLPVQLLRARHQRRRPKRATMASRDLPHAASASPPHQGIDVAA